MLWSQESNLTPQSTRGKSSLQRAKALEIGRVRADQPIKPHKLVQLYTRISLLITELGIKMPHYCSHYIRFKQLPLSLGTKWQQLFKADLTLAFQLSRAFSLLPRDISLQVRCEAAISMGHCSLVAASRLQGYYKLCTGAAVVPTSFSAFQGRKWRIAWFSQVRSYLHIEGRWSPLHSLW